MELIQGVTTRELVQLIESKRVQGETIRLHPNGFLQLSLGNSDVDWRAPGLRFHVWSDTIEPPRKDVPTPIHDHIFDIESYVLLGQLQNTNYQVTPAAQGNHRIMSAKVSLGGLDPTSERVDALTIESFLVNPQNKYTLARYAFHTSESLQPLTATLMSKTNTDFSHRPRVLVPVDSPDHQLVVGRSVDQKLAWKILEEAVAQIQERYV